VEFTEVRRPAIVKGRSGDVPLRGTFWVDPANGRVLRTRIEGGDRLSAVQFHVEVNYAPDARLGLLVPVEMKERYDGLDERVDRKATYGNYRRFEVDARIVGASAAP
jgi:hypothetical protein